MTENNREEILKDIREGYIDAWDNLTIDELFETIEKEHNEIQQYRAIGTVEDCRVAVERMKPKKVKDRIDDYGDYFGRCPVCDRGVVSQFGTPYQYCPKCGIKLDWSE